MTIHNLTAFSASVDWIADLLMGSVGSAAAIVAIAGLGFAMLHGRLAVRDGARMVVGCFIVFGAPVIAQNLANLAAHSFRPLTKGYEGPQPIPMVIPPPSQHERDPYAGASVPM